MNITHIKTPQIPIILDLIMLVRIENKRSIATDEDNISLTNLQSVMQRRQSPHWDR